MGKPSLNKVKLALRAVMRECNGVRITLKHIKRGELEEVRTYNLLNAKESLAKADDNIQAAINYLGGI